MCVCDGVGGGGVKVQLPLLSNLQASQFRLHASVHPHVPLEVTLVLHKGTKSPASSQEAEERASALTARSPAPGRPGVVPCTWPYEEQTTGSMKS